jgi:cold shock CspA family protein
LRASGNYGFLSYEVEDGKKLYYSQAEVKDKSNLQVGDQVEFELVTNKRSGKSAACSIVKLT